MSEKVEATTGPEGNVQCTFDGEALELVGYTASVLHLPVPKLVIQARTAGVQRSG